MHVNQLQSLSTWPDHTHNSISEHISEFQRRKSGPILKTIGVGAGGEPDGGGDDAAGQHHRRGAHVASLCVMHTVTTPSSAAAPPIRAAAARRRRQRLHYRHVLLQGFKFTSI